MTPSGWEMNTFDEEKMCLRFLDSKSKHDTLVLAVAAFLVFNGIERNSIFDPGIRAPLESAINSLLL